MILRSAPIAALAIALFAAALIACKSNSINNPIAMSTPAGTATARAASTPSGASGNIRRIDLGQSAPVQQFISTTNGQYVQSEVIYSDLTGDGVEDAVVPISSGGTLGDVAYVVLTSDGAGVKQLFASPQDPDSPGGVAVSVSNGKLVDTRPIYGPTDPNCCPSQLKTTTYAWDGAKFVRESTNTSPGPAGGVKGTPAAGAPQ